MKAIDLHIHTVPTIKDSNFNFCLDSLKTYVNKTKLAAIAITNHNVFDLSQFETIENAIDIKVFPGVEVDLEGGHILVISENQNLEDFDSKVKKIAEKIVTKNCSITLHEFKDIFDNLEEYLLIPHFNKKPEIKDAILEELNDYVFTGEVSSPSKFIRSSKDTEQKLTPLLFSDARITDRETDIKYQRTFIDIGDISLKSLKTALKDKSKVCLSKNEGNSLFLANKDNLELSTGLNVVLGERASGKTILLKSIEKNNINVKHIRQFELVKDGFEEESNSKKYDQKLNKKISNKYSINGENYLKEFEQVVNDMLEVDISKDELQIERYIESLKKYAEQQERADVFSKTKLFNESEFVIEKTQNINNLIDSIINVVSNKEYSENIKKYIDIKNLKKLLVELCEIRISLANENLLKSRANEIIRNIKNQLQLESSAPYIEQVDFESFLINLDKIEKFDNIVFNLRKQKQIGIENIASKYSVVMNVGEYEGAQDIRSNLEISTAMSTPFQKYDHSYDYLMSLKQTDISSSEIYKYFCKITYDILNNDDLPVSGGERAEFNLINAIEGATDKDMLLIDEPESSFDNLFLRKDVNLLLKKLSEKMPVVISTHNNTVALSIKPDYIVHTRKERIEDKVLFRTYTGKPRDEFLSEINSNFEIKTNEILIDHLEGGLEYYSERREYYDI